MGCGSTKKAENKVVFLQKPTRDGSRAGTQILDTSGNHSIKSGEKSGKLPMPVLFGFSNMFALYSQIHPDYPKEYTDEQWKRQVEIIKENVRKANEKEAIIKKREVEERNIIQRKEAEVKAKEEARIEKERKQIAEEQKLLRRVSKNMEDEEQKQVQEEHERKLKELQKEEEKRKVAEEVKRAMEEERDRLQQIREKREAEERAEAEERLREGPPKRFSPEPPKVEFLLDKEDSYVDLPPVIDKEQLAENRRKMEKRATIAAKEMAEKKRIEEEEKLAKQAGESARMNDIAMNILSKYA